MASVWVDNFIIPNQNKLPILNIIKQKFKDKYKNHPPQLMTQQLFYIWGDPNHYDTHQSISVPVKNVQEIAAGERHIVLRTQAGIMGYGDNSRGQLGLEDIEEENGSFVTIWSKFVSNKITKVACGWNHTLILDEFGEVFSAGEGKHGALGQGRGANSYTFKPVPGLKGIKTISAGRDHSLALSSIKVFGWGSSMDGQLGIPKQKICYEPQELYIYPSSLCFAGSKYSIFVTQKGIYSTGQNDMGQLGLGNRLKVKMAKKVNGVEEPIVWIGGCSSYSVLRTAQNQFYVSGTGCLGQYLYPTKIKQFRNCQQLVLGEDFGIVEDQNNAYYSWNTRKDNAPMPNQCLSSLPIQSIVCGSKLLICQIADHTKNNLYSRAHSLKPQNMNIYQKSEIMARSSIEYCYNQQFHERDPTENSGKQRRNRKKSKGLQKYNYAQDELGSKKNRLYTEQQHENGNYDERAWQQSYYREIQDNADHETRKKIPEQVTSPYFKKQMTNSLCVQSPRPEQLISNRTQLFDDQSRINQPIVMAPDNVISRENSRTALTISQETDPWCQTSIRNNLSKVGQMNKLFSEREECELRNKINALEVQNKKKEDEIKKLRRQMLQLIQIVESDMCLKNLAEQKNSQLAKKKKQLKQLVEEPPDVFTSNLENLRGLLNKTIDSLTYAS